MGTLHKIQEGITFVNDLNKSMTNIQMITGQSHSSVVQMTKDFSDLASQLHETTSNMMDASEEFLRAGNNAEETKKLLEASTVMSKIAGQGQQESAQSMIAIMNSFKLSASDMMSVVDRMVAIDNTSATSTRELSAAIKDTAQSAQLSGSSLTNLISYIGTVSSISRKSADTIGNAFKTIYQRFSSIREGTSVDEFGDDISNVEKDLNTMGIALRSDLGTFKDFDIVIQELSKKWATLSDVQKSQITMDIAGNRQRETFLTLMNNMNTALNMQITEANSAGNAMARYNTYAKSTEANLNDLTNAFQKLFMKSISSSFVNTFINALTGLVNMMSKMGGVIPIVAGLLSGVFTMAVIGAIGWVQKLIVEGIALNTVFGGLPVLVGLLVTSFTALGYAMANNTTYYDDLIKRQNDLESSYKNQVKSADELSTKQNAQAEVARVLAQRINELNSTEKLNVGQKAEMKNVVDQLNQVLPNLNLQIDTQTGKIIGNTNAINDNIKALRNQAIAQAYQAKANAAGEAYVNQQLLLGDTQKQLDDKKKELQKLQGKAFDIAKTNGSITTQPSAITVGDSILGSSITDKANEVSKLQKLVDKQTQDLKKYDEDIKKYTTDAGKYLNTPSVTKNTGKNSNYIPTGSSGTGSAKSTLEPDNTTIEKDRYYQLNQELAKTNALLDTNSALQENVSYKNKIKLLESEIQLLQNKQKIEHLIAEEERKEREKLVESLSDPKYGVKFAGTGDNTYITNAKQALEKLADEYNKANKALTSKSTKDEKQHVKDLKTEYDELKKSLDRFFEIQLTDIPKAQQEYAKLSKQISDTKQNIVDSKKQEISDRYNILTSNIDEEIKQSQAKQAKLVEGSSVYMAEMNKQISLYKQKQDLIHKEADELRKILATQTKGTAEYNKTNSEIASLSEQWQEIDKSIGDIYSKQKDIQNDVMSQLSDLRKKDYEDQKKAEDERHQKVIDNIDKEIEEIERKYEREDYLRDIQNQDKDITKKQEEINALALDTSAESMARKAQLQTELDDLLLKKSDSVEKHKRDQEKQTLEDKKDSEDEKYNIAKKKLDDLSTDEAIFAQVQTDLANNTVEELNKIYGGFFDTFEGGLTRIGNTLKIELLDKLAQLKTSMGDSNSIFGKEIPSTTSNNSITSVISTLGSKVDILKSVDITKLLKPIDIMGQIVPSIIDKINIPDIKPSTNNTVIQPVVTINSVPNENVDSLVKRVKTEVWTDFDRKLAVAGYRV